MNRVGQNHSQGPNHVVIPAQRFHNNSGNAGQIPLQVQIQHQQQQTSHQLQQPQQQQFERLMENLQNRSPNPQVTQNPQQTPQAQQQQAVVMSDQLRNMERKERMRQIEQQRGSAQPWQASGQIIMTSGQHFNAQNSNSPRFLNQTQYFNQPVRFIQGTNGQPMNQSMTMSQQQLRFPPGVQEQASRFPSQFQHIQARQMQQPQIHVHQQQQQQQTPQQINFQANLQNDMNKNNLDEQKSKENNVDQYINKDGGQENAGIITINGKIQIETVKTTPIGINSIHSSATQLNSNFSNNGTDENKGEATENGSNGENTVESVAKVVETVSKVVIPQVDGYADSSSDESETEFQFPQYDGNDSDTSATSSLSSNIQISGSSQPLVQTSGVVLATVQSTKTSKIAKNSTKSPQKTQIVFTIGGEKKKDDAVRINSGNSDSKLPRNISPKPKESSPKQTIVATAKVQKPNSPGSHGSPTSRPARIMSPGSIRSISNSPNSRSHSPSYSTPTRISVSSGNTSNSSNRNNVKLVVTNNRPPLKLQMVTKGVNFTDRSKKPILIREQPLILEDMVNEELAAQNKNTDDASPTISTTVSNAVPKLPPAPNVDPDQIQNLSEVDEITRAKLQVFKALQGKQAKQQGQVQKGATIRTMTVPTTTASKIQTATQSRSKRPQPTDTTITIATQSPTGTNSVGQANFITLTQPRKGAKNQQTQQIVIKGDGKKGNPPNKLDILRQIQSVKNPDQNMTISFGGKTVPNSQIIPNLTTVASIPRTSGSINILILYFENYYS